MTPRELADRLTAAIEVDIRLGDDDVPRVEIVGAEALIEAFADEVRLKERERWVRKSLSEYDQWQYLQM